MDILKAILYITVIVLCPVWTGMIAYLKRKSLPVIVLAAAVGFLFGPFILSQRMGRPLSSVELLMLAAAEFFGFGSFLFLIAQCVLLSVSFKRQPAEPEPAPRQDQEITLPMPYPPGTSNGGNAH